MEKTDKARKATLLMGAVWSDPLLPPVEEVEPSVQKIASFFVWMPPSWREAIALALLNGETVFVGYANAETGGLVSPRGVPLSADVIGESYYHDPILAVPRENPNAAFPDIRATVFIPVYAALA